MKNDKGLSLSEKIVRLGARLRDPEWRRYGLLLLAGKFLGAGLLFVLLLGLTSLPRLCGPSAQAPPPGGVARQAATAGPRPDKVPADGRPR